MLNVSINNIAQRMHVSVLLVFMLLLTACSGGVGDDNAVTYTVTTTADAGGSMGPTKEFSSSRRRFATRSGGSVREIAE